MEETKKVAVQATAIQVYREQRDGAVVYMKDTKPSVEQVLYYQELLYRIAILETIQALYKATPKTVDGNVLVPHYQLLEAFITCLIGERKLSGLVTKDDKKAQETALNSLNLILDHGKKKFLSYAPPESEEQYRNDIFNFIETVLIAWVQYRNTMVNVSTIQDDVEAKIA